MVTGLGPPGYFFLGKIWDFSGYRLPGIFSGDFFGRFFRVTEVPLLFLGLLVLGFGEPETGVTQVQGTQRGEYPPREKTARYPPGGSQKDRGVRSTLHNIDCTQSGITLLPRNTKYLEGIPKTYPNSGFPVAPRINNLRGKLEVPRFRVPNSRFLRIRNTRKRAEKQPKTGVCKCLILKSF